MYVCKVISEKEALKLVLDLLHSGVVSWHSWQCTHCLVDALDHGSDHAVTRVRVMFHLIISFPRIIVPSPYSPSVTLPQLKQRITHLLYYTLSGDLSS